MYYKNASEVYPEKDLSICGSRYTRYLYYDRS